MQDPATFPLGDTLGGGAYRVTEKLREGGSQLLYLGESTSSPSQRVLITAIWVPKGISLEELRAALGAQKLGTFELQIIGAFDVQGSNGTRRIYQEQHFGLVERLTLGDWLVRLTKDVISPRKAVALGLSVGQLLSNAAERGNLVVGVRPEYVWAERGEDGTISATGLSDRYRLFLAHAGGRCAVPAALLRRSYLAPELHRQTENPGSSASLVFSLATMMAEWVTGKYPFPDSWEDSSCSSLRRGQHIPLDLPPRLAHLLKLGLQAEPANRPSLAAFLAALEALGPEDLAS